MKYAKWILVLMLTMLPVLASAQLASNQKIVAQVPFEFVIGHQVIPAGECVVKWATMDAKTLSIRNVDVKLQMFSWALPDQTNDVAGNYAMVFHKYGNQYFLRELEVRGSRTIYRLPESPAEAELTAKNVTATEQILIATLN